MKKKKKKTEIELNNSWEIKPDLLNDWDIDIDLKDWDIDIDLKDWDIDLKDWNPENKKKK